MQIIKKSLDAYLLAPKLINDQRGWFEIPFSVQDLQALGLEWRSTFQLNHSFTTYKGTVRGPNYQEEPYGQAKVIRCVKGRLYSVGIELDRNSENFGKFVGFELSAENKYLMYLPKTYAHGFVTLEDGTELEYLTDNEYNYESAKAAEDFNVDLSKSWMIGGGENDIKAGIAAGCKTVLVNGEGSDHKEVDFGQNYTCESVLEFVEKYL